MKYTGPVYQPGRRISDLDKNFLNSLTTIKYEKREIAQLCPTLCDTMDCSPPGSSVHGIFQPRILEWVAISSSRGSSQLRASTWEAHIYCGGGLVAKSCLTLCDTMDCSPPGSSIHGILQARILEWVAIPFSRRSSRPRDQTQVSRIAGRRF